MREIWYEPDDCKSCFMSDITLYEMDLGRQHSEFYGINTTVEGLHILHIILFPDTSYFIWGGLK